MHIVGKACKAAKGSQWPSCPGIVAGELHMLRSRRRRTAACCRGDPLAALLLVYGSRVLLATMQATHQDPLVFPST